MDTRRSEVEIEAAWRALFNALISATVSSTRRNKRHRGREIGVRGTGGVVDGYTSKPGRLTPAYKFSVEQFLDAKSLRDAKRMRTGVARS